MNEAKRPLVLRFGMQERIMFCKRIAMLTRSGVPLSQALAMLDEHHRTKSAAHIHARIIEDVARGASLASAFGRFRSVFGDFAVDIIAVGEASGVLSQNFDYLAEELRKKDALRKKVVGALVYPAIIVLATFGIALVLTVYIFPKITPVFKSFGRTLPLSTRILIGLSGFLLHHGIALFCALVAASIAAFFITKKKRVRRRVDRLILRAPVFGRLSRAYHAGNAARSLSLLLKAGMPIVAALGIAARSAGNITYQEALENMGEEIARGQKLSLQIRRSPQLFTPLSAQMVGVGEETGDLPESLLYIAQMHEEEISELAKNLTTILEPLLMITMGLIVGFIAVSIITPIYGITQTLTPQ